MRFAVGRNQYMSGRVEDFAQQGYYARVQRKALQQSFGGFAVPNNQGPAQQQLDGAIVFPAG